MKSERQSLLATLSRELEVSLGRFGRDNEGLMLRVEEPRKLKQEVDRLALLFEQGAPPEPPMQQRINALARLRRGESDLSRRDWVLITWGLCDHCGANGKPIEEQPLFDAVMRHTDGWIERSDVPRRGWFGLLNSYFSYEAEEPLKNWNWTRLRGCLVDTMPILVGSLNRPKLWSRMLERHHDIFSSDAGRSLRQVLFYGSREELQELKGGLPIPESSWLWRRVVAHQIDHLNSLNDAEFIRAIPAMLDFLGTHPLYADEILAALLTRYCQSAQRGESNEMLKNESFTRWGNPQLRSATRWAKVEPPVRAMVLRWFAKEDLEHFFSLLQGDGQVDQARLRYWMRFLDHISYTRILLGADALSNSHPEFRNFKAKNAGRYGHLLGGSSHNNGFIMRINNQYFVEFSGTGNACYAYEENQLPFDPSARTLHSSTELKKALHDRQPPYGDNRILHGGNWQWKADEFLARRGIRPGDAGAASPVSVKSYQAQFAAPVMLPSAKTAAPASLDAPPALLSVASADIPAFNATTVNLTPAPKPKTSQTRWPSAALTSPPPIQAVVKTAGELARINNVQVLNNLGKGGAFWVLTSEQNSVLGRELTQLGMTHHPSKGFWIK